MTEDELEVIVWLDELDEIEEDWIEEEKPCLEKTILTVARREPVCCT
jgi:hypothetical protein